MGSGWRGGHDKLPLHFEETFASLINERGSRLDEKEVKADLRGQWDNGTKVPGRDAIERDGRSDGNFMAKDERSLARSGS